MQIHKSAFLTAILGTVMGYWLSPGIEKESEERIGDCPDKRPIAGLAVSPAQWNATSEKPVLPREKGITRAASSDGLLAAPLTAPFDQLPAASTNSDSYPDESAIDFESADAMRQSDEANRIQLEESFARDCEAVLSADSCAPESRFD